MEALSQLLSSARNGALFWLQSGRKRKRKRGADRLKVNLCKTEAIPVGEGIPMETLASVLGLEESFRKRLSLWKRKYLSKGGQLTLLKSTLSSLPTYFLSLFVIPKRVCARLEKIQRDFLWGGGALENRPHLWLWTFANENESLWKQIISNKYDLQEGGWCSKGDGIRVKFWKTCGVKINLWNMFSPSCLIYPSTKKARLLRLGRKTELGVTGACFNRHLNDWEVGEVGSLLSKLHPLTIRRGVDDLLQWKENKMGPFQSSLFITHSQRALDPPSWLELFRLLGFQLGLASLVGSGLEQAAHH
ncbi:hypothetical protein CK203_020541 [Vitis vinifera]|uniref:Uncharacterized protein n=1 Tax=Vitis vinifera TaxID=29760 RepID=A0A438FM82_VITVI|nr:hypothetical protein CK203_020541 [Vitis vinifera]